MPVAGDWVAVRVINSQQAIVEAVLPRRTLFARRAAGGREDQQALAANGNTVLLVCGLDGDFNLRRLELAASPTNFTHAKEAVEFSNSALKLIEAGKVIEGGKFNKDASTAILYQTQAIVAVDAKKNDEAIALYTKSSASDPGNVGIVAYNLLGLASLHKVPYDAAVGVYRAFPEADRQAATPSPEVKAALDAVYAKADPLIDACARFVALTRARNVAAETREQVLGSLKTVYGTRFAGDTTGLEPLITKLQAEYAPK
jgi:hypothetical protein